MKILLVEDNHTIACQLTEFLEAQGWQVDYAASGALGIDIALHAHFDLVILDLGLPDINGIKVCEKLKTQSPVNIPVLMLTASDTFEDKAKSFKMGADDYVTKPFDFRELALRCEALTRRQSLFQSSVITIGELRLNVTEKQAMRDGKIIPLNTTSFAILLTLVKAYPQAVSRSYLIHTLWGDNPPDSDSLKSHIYNLRRALDKDYEEKLIETITNIGYKLKIGSQS